MKKVKAKTPLLSQMPVILFICAAFSMIAMTTVMIYSGATH